MLDCHATDSGLSSRTNVRLVLNVVKELDFKILRLRLRTLRGFLPPVEMTEEKPGIGWVERRETHRLYACRFALCNSFGGRLMP